MSPVISTPVLSSVKNELLGASDSPVLIRVCGVLSAAPILLCLTAHFFLYLGRLSHQKKYWKTCSWFLVKVGIFLLLLSKFVAVPFGIFLLFLGLLVSNIDVSIAGVATLALVYSANIGNWGAAGRLWHLLYTLPDIIHMSRWHTDGRGMPHTFDLTYPDPYERGWKDFKRLLVRANEDPEPPSLLWYEEVIIVVLIYKFVMLSDREIEWTPRTDGPLGDPSMKVLVHSLQRFEKGWEGKPGVFVKRYTQFTSDPAKPARETTLRFVVMLFELICRNAVTNRSRKVDLLKNVVKQQRQENGSMQWVHDIFLNCMTNSSEL